MIHAVGNIGVVSALNSAKERGSDRRRQASKNDHARCSPLKGGGSRGGGAVILVMHVRDYIDLEQLEGKEHHNSPRLQHWSHSFLKP